VCMRLSEYVCVCVRHMSQRQNNGPIRGITWALNASRSEAVHEHIRLHKRLLTNTYIHTRKYACIHTQAHTYMRKNIRADLRRPRRTCPGYRWCSDDSGLMRVNVGKPQKAARTTTGCVSVRAPMSRYWKGRRSCCCCWPRLQGTHVSACECVRVNVRVCSQLDRGPHGIVSTNLAVALFD
jgi:hypothetical protein